MKTIKIEVTLSIGLAGADQQDELTIEVPDTATDSEIEEACETAYQEWMWNFIDGGYTIVDNTAPEIVTGK